MIFLRNTALAVAALTGSVAGQTSFLNSPELKWTASFSPMGQGNGVVMAPDSNALYATSNDGSVGALHPEDGSVIWTYKPTVGGSFPLSGNGEVSVAIDGSSLVYGVTENLNRDGESCLVVALSASGDLLWTSPALTGACQGTPYISTDKKYVFVTHNSAFSTVGHFSVLTDDGTVLWDATDPVGPFSRPAFYRMPTEGNYGAGQGNNQDILVWSYAPLRDAITGEGGSAFAFQLPFNYSPDLGTDRLAITLLLPTVGWRSTNPPLLAAGGMQMFWAVSRGQFRSWVNTRFNALPSGEATFNRGNPSFLAAQCTPAADNDMTPTIVCTCGAAPEFICMKAADISAGAIWSVRVAGKIWSNPIFSTEGDRVYFAQDRGVITAANPLTGEIFFEQSTQVPLVSNFALSEDGSELFYGDQVGNVVAWKVAEPAVPPTEAPVVTETEMPTSVPGSETPAPFAGSSTTPTVTPRVESPNATPTVQPVAPTESTSGACRAVVVTVIVTIVMVAALL